MGGGCWVGARCGEWEAGGVDDEEAASAARLVSPLYYQLVAALGRGAAAAVHECRAIALPFDDNERVGWLLWQC
jgi:hypothetical protein